MENQLQNLKFYLFSDYIIGDLVFKPLYYQHLLFQELHYQDNNQKYHDKFRYFTTYY